jgi:hypothetical protein
MKHPMPKFREQLLDGGWAQFYGFGFFPVFGRDTQGRVELIQHDCEDLNWVLFRDSVELERGDLSECLERAEVVP